MVESTVSSLRGPSPGGQDGRARRAGPGDHPQEPRWRLSCPVPKGSNGTNPSLCCGLWPAKGTQGPRHSGGWTAWPCAEQRREEATSLHRLSGPTSTLQDSLLPSRGECRTHSPSPPRRRLGSWREQPQDSLWAMTLPDSGDVTGCRPHGSQEQSRDLAVKGPR